MKRKLSPLFLALSLITSAMAQTPAAPAPETSAKPQAEHLVTPAEAKELFRSVDEILQFASKDTLLPIKHPVEKAMRSRPEVEKILSEKFESDADRIRFERSELVLKKFGLLPRQFDLHAFLIKLLTEQIAGFYDEKTRKINLLDWVTLDMQKPVMAHELTHALQDQSFDMAKFRKQHEAIEKRGPEDPNALVKTDDESSCFTAVVEGQAMVVLADYILAPQNLSVEKAPQVVELMQQQMEKEKDSPVLESAPLLIKEELVFPYTYGMKFIRDLLISGGKPLAFAGVLQRLPRTTREILEPQEYLAGRTVPTLLLPDMAFLKKDYEPFDAGSIGEFDVKILLKQYVDDATATRFTPEWRGGAYYAAGRKGATPADRNATSHIGLLYISRWSSEAVARQFGQVYASALQQRYQQVQPGAANAERQKYLTADGPVILEQHGDLLIITESFDEATAERLIEAARKQAQAEANSSPKTSSQMVPPAARPEIEIPTAW